MIRFHIDASDSPEDFDKKLRELEKALGMTDIDPAPGQTDDDGDDDDDDSPLDVADGNDQPEPIRQFDGTEELNPDYAVVYGDNRTGGEHNSARAENGLWKEAEAELGEMGLAILAELWLEADHINARVPLTVRQIAKRDTRTRNQVRKLLDGLQRDGWITGYDKNGVQLPYTTHADGRAIIGRLRDKH